MNRSDIVALIKAMHEVGIVPHAWDDAIERAERRFGTRAMDADAARQWAEELRVVCPHFFERSQPGSPVPAPASTPVRGRGNPVPLPAVPPDLAKEWQHLPPSERISKAR